MTGAAAEILSSRDAAPVEVARRVGRYTIYKAISKGGTATVHFGRLHGESGFARPVAIKRLLAGFSSDPDLVAMLIDEARIAGRVQHPNVVQIIDVIEDDGEPLLVLEYVHGTSLAHLMRIMASVHQRIPHRIASAIAIDALRGLHAAHEAHDEAGSALDIVHRDVSPQNILLDVSGIARVTDFGVAKARGRLQRTTETGSLKGKIGYLAPEQIYGTTTRQSDVFSLGIVLWEMMTCTRLFSGDSEGATLAATLSTRVDAPSKRGADCPAALDAVALKSLEREPSARYATAAQMADAIAAACSVATPSEVAEWLARVAGHVFDERRRALRELESGTHVIVDDAGSASDAALAASDVAADAPPKRRIPLIAAAAVTALLGSFGIFYVLGTGSRDASAHAAEVPPVAADTVAAPDSPHVTATAPTAPAEEIGAEPPSTSPTNGTARAATGATRPAARKPGARARPDCTVPYEVDAKGRKIWRRECF